VKFTTPAGDFLECLKSVSARAKASANIPILRHILLNVEGAQLTMTGHDMTASCEAHLGIDAPANGSCAVPADAIVRLMGSIPKAAHVTVEQDGLVVTVKSGRSRYKLAALDAANFPAALACENGAGVELSAEDVETLFGRARQALDPRDTRPFGQGLYLHSADGSLCTSGISLFHFVRLSVKAQMPDLIGVIVPISAVDEIAKLCKGGGHLTVSDHTIAAEANGRRFCSKLIEQKYPDYKSRLPPVVKAYVDVDRDEALAAVRRLTSIAAADSVINMTFGDTEITLSLSGVNEGVEFVPCSSESKVEGQVSIAAQRFIEMLELPRGEVVQLHFTKGSMFVRVVDPSDPTSIFVESTRIPQGYRAAAAEAA
jgi:DNA polymerase-3 subunit beta